jgi:Rod binding domain-containing protein
VNDISSLGSHPGVTIEPLAANENRVLRHPASATAENAKIDKSAKDFESILLENWLQKAEQSFGSLPGEEDGDDGGKEQYMGIAMQSLGASMTAAGGIGIAKMIATALHKTENAGSAQPLKTGPASAK